MKAIQVSGQTTDKPQRDMTWFSLSPYSSCLNVGVGRCSQGLGQQGMMWGLTEVRQTQLRGHRER